MKAEMSGQQRAAMCAWAEANGLDPNLIDEWTEVSSGTIHYRQVVGTGADGNLVWEERRAPMVADFPVDGIRIPSRPGVVGGAS